MLTMGNSLKLLEEVNRIGELMGRKILSEQAWSKIVDDLVDFVGKAGSKLDNTSKYIIQDLKKSATDKEIVENLLKLFKHNPDLGKKIYETIYKNLDQGKQGAIDAIKNRLDQGIKNGTLTDTQVDDIIRNWPNTNVSTPFDEFRQIIRKELQDIADNARRSVNPSNAPNNTPPTTWARGANDLASVTKTELEKLERLYRAQGLGKSFIRAYRAFVQNVIDMFTKQDELILEMQRLSTSLKNISDSANRTNVTNRIGELVQKLVAQDKQNFTIIEDWIKRNVLDYTIKNNILKSKGYEAAGKLLSGQAKIDWDKTYGSFMTRRKNSIKGLNQVINPFTWIGKGNKYGGVLEKWSQIFRGNDFAEFRRWALTGQTKSRAGIKAMYEQFGLPTTILSLGGEYAYGYLMLILMYSTVDYFTDVAAAEFRDTPYLKDFQWLQNQVKSYDEHVKTSDDDSAAGATIETTADIVRYVTDELKSFTIAFPGVFDDIIIFWNDIRKSGQKKDSNAQDLQQKADELKRKAQEELDKLKQKADSLRNAQDQGDTTATEEQPVTEPSGTYGTTLNEFKRYLSSPEGWGNEISFLKTVKTEEINGVEYYIALDTDGEEYFFTYNNGKFIQY